MATAKPANHYVMGSGSAHLTEPIDIDDAWAPLLLLITPSITWQC